jgi:hypothetical protein
MGEELYNALTEFRITTNPVGPTEMCSNENYSKVHTDKHLPDVFPIQNGLKLGYVLLSLLFILL